MIRWFSVRRLLVWTVLASSFLLVMVWLGRAIYRDAASGGRRGHSRKARLRYEQNARDMPRVVEPGPTKEAGQDHHLPSGPKHDYTVDESHGPKAKGGLASDDSPLIPIPLVIPEEANAVQVPIIVGTKWAAPFALRNTNDLHAAWKAYLQYRQGNSRGSMEEYLWDTFGAVTMSVSDKKPTGAGKTPPQSMPKVANISSKYEQVRFESSIRRHVALLYGDYLIRGGQEARHFGIPVCRTIGLASDGAMSDQQFKTKELEQLEGSQGSLAFVDIKYAGPDGRPLPWISQQGDLGGKLRLVVKDFAAHKKRRHHSKREGGKSQTEHDEHDRKDRRTTSEIKIFGKEHYALDAIHHPGVIQPVCYEKSPHLRIIYPFLAGGDLVTLSSDHLAYTDAMTGKLLNPDNTFLPRFFRQLVEAVHAVHAAGILHLDLKPENLVIHGPNRHFVLPADHPALSAYHLVLLDFGLAMRLEDARQRDCLHVGTDVTMAPEQVLCNHVGDRGTDWWGLAAAMWRTRVFWEPSIGEDERTRLLNAKCEQWGHPILPEQPWFSAEFRALMQIMLKPTPRERDFSRAPRRLQRLLDHPYLLRGLDLESRGRRLRELGVTRLEDLPLSLNLSESEPEESASLDAEPTGDTGGSNYEAGQS